MQLFQIKKFETLKFDFLPTICHRDILKMLLVALLLVLMAALLALSCEVHERDSLLLSQESSLSSFIIHSIDDVFNGSLDMKSLLQVLRYKNMDRQLPIFFNKKHFSSQVSFPSDETTDICGKSSRKSFLQLQFLSLPNSTLTGMLYGCDTHFKNISKILIVNESTENKTEYYFNHVSPGIEKKFASKICDCEKIVEDFKRNCLLSKYNTEDMNSHLIVATSLFVGMVVTVIGIRKFLLKNKIASSS